MKLLIVTSAGGHLLQTSLLREWWSRYERVWVVRDDVVTRGFLHGEKTYYAHFPEHRHVVNFFKNFWLAWHILRDEQPDIIFSNGAGVAVPFFWIGKIFGKKLFFLDTFFTIPKTTLTGWLLLLCSDLFLVQHPLLLRTYYYPARYVGSVWDLLGNSEKNLVRQSKKKPARLKRVFVVTGTTYFPAQRLVDAVISFFEANPHVQVTIQVGTAKTKRVLPRHIRAVSWLEHEAFLKHLRDADIIISTAGEGTCLEIARFSRVSPILFPRLPQFGEHIDTQQLETARELQGRGWAKMAVTETQLRRLLRVECAHTQNNRRQEKTTSISSRIRRPLPSKTIPDVLTMVTSYI